METTNISDEILVLYHQLLQQWNKRNAAGMTALFATNGTLIGFDGSQLNGQKEIYNVLDEIFSNFPTAAYISIVKEVRVLSETSGLLLAVVGMVAEGNSDITPAVNAVQSVTVTFADGKWRVSLFQNTPAAFHGRPELAEQLTVDLRKALQESLKQPKADEPTVMTD